MAAGRPSILGWLYYAFGGRLSTAHAQWVLHDLTCRTWYVRHLLRTLVQCSPALFLLFFPAPTDILAMMLGIVAFGALYYAATFAWEIRNHRLYQHGFVPEIVLPPKPEDDD